MQLKHLDHQLTRRLFKKWFNVRYISSMNQFYSTGAEVVSSFSHSPIIIVGMHRSGTSLLIDALTKLGLFSGDITGPDTSESLLFQYLNDAALSAAQAHWSTPENLAHALKNPAILYCLKKQFSETLRSKWAHLYSIRKPRKVLCGAAGAFGWKDPRNCLTMPIWSELFPNARYVFIHRHGVDVAESHINRETHVGNSVYIARCLEAERSFSLWEEYNQQVLNSLAKTPKTQIIQVAFEDLVQSPRNVLSDLAEFCLIKPHQSKLEEFAKHCNQSKAFAYRKKSIEYANSVYQDSTILSRLNYTL